MNNNEQNTFVLGEVVDSSVPTTKIFPIDNFVEGHCPEIWNTLLENVERVQFNNYLNGTGDRNHQRNYHWLKMIYAVIDANISWYPGTAYDVWGRPLDHLVGLYVHDPKNLEKLREVLANV